MAAWLAALAVVSCPPRLGARLGVGGGPVGGWCEGLLPVTLPAPSHAWLPCPPQAAAVFTIRRVRFFWCGLEKLKAVHNGEQAA